MTISEADAAIVRFLERTDRLITCSDAQGRRAARELIMVLQRADRSLSQRLNEWVRRYGSDVRFSSSSMLVYQNQIRIVTEFVKNRLLGITSDQALSAARIAIRRVSGLTRTLEQAFTGISMGSRFNESLISRIYPSLMARHSSSVQRYGEAMIRSFESQMSQGFVEGISQGQMVDRIIRTSGQIGRSVAIQPNMTVNMGQAVTEGAFIRNRSWAWRIVRTETAEAQNAAAQTEIEDSLDDFPDMQRKILATIDKRTAQDSLGVHGQIRDVNSPFMDGAGRVYMRPPSRPNDREVVIPWRPDWPNTRHSRPLSESDQERIWERNERWQRERQKNRRRKSE
jgi:hypothetical protein